LRLGRSRARETAFLQGIAQIFGRLRLDDDLRRTGPARPLDQAIDRLGACRHGAARNVNLARGADLADLHARHRAIRREAQTFHAPSGVRLDLAPTPGLKQRSVWNPLHEFAIPQLGVGAHAGPTSVTSPASRWATSFT